MKHPLRLVPSVFASCMVVATAACGGQVTGVLEPNLDTDPPAEPAGGPQLTADKVDILLAVDNSWKMGPKQELLASSVGHLIERLVHPLCVEANGTSRGASVDDERGTAVCPNGGSLERAPVRDIHLGVLSSSLGNFGNGPQTAVCTTGASDDRSQLINRTGVSPTEPEGFVAFGAAAGQAAYVDVEAFKGAATQLIAGVGETGCGFEAQLESLYQFLIAPDPWAEVSSETYKAAYQGINEQVLRQRRAFLRPDSLVSVILLTDEDDGSLDPLAVSGTAYYFGSTDFPNGIIRDDGTRTAARGTAACATEPMSSACTSCAFAGRNPAVPAADADPICASQETAYYQPAEDPLNVRFFDMKRRFGIEPRYPLSRYSRGLSQPNVPSRDAEHVDLPTGIENYDVNAADCRNPLFAAALPASGAEELCNLPAGPRNASLVYFTVIGGVPNSLVDADDQDVDGRLTADAWTRLLGQNYEAYDQAGIDPRMLPSITPRVGRPGVDQPDFVGADPGNETHREWDTDGADLQFACTYALAAPIEPTSITACSAHFDPPLCADGDAEQDRTQLRAGAVPTPRPLAVAKALGRQATVASICAANTTTASAADYGYKSAFDALATRFSVGLRK